MPLEPANRNRGSYIPYKDRFIAADGGEEGVVRADAYGGDVVAVTGVGLDEAAVVGGGACACGVEEADFAVCRAG